MKQLYVVIILLLAFVSLAHATQITVLSTNPAPIQAGEYADVTLQMSLPHLFNDRPREDLTFSIKQTEYIRPFANTQFVVHELFTGRVATHTFRVFFSEQIPPGMIPLTVVETDGRVTIEHTVWITVEQGLTQADLRIGHARSSPQRLIADSDDNILRVTLQNLGEQNAELLHIRLVSDSITESYFNSLQQSLSRIDAGQQHEVEFTFDIPKTEDYIIPAQLEIEYRVRDVFNSFYTRKTTTLPFNITLSSVPRLQIIQDTQSEFRVGQRNQELQIQIENTNEREARNVRLRLFPDPASPFDFDVTTIFVSPSILEGESRTVTIEFDVLPTALLQEYVVLAQIETLVGTNRHTTEERLVINVTQPQASTIQQNALFLTILFIVLALVIGYFYRRKK